MLHQILGIFRKTDVENLIKKTDGWPELEYLFFSSTFDQVHK